VTRESENFKTSWCLLFSVKGGNSASLQPNHKVTKAAKFTKTGTGPADEHQFLKIIYTPVLDRISLLPEKKRTK